MKKSTRRVIETFPLLEQKLLEHGSNELEEEIPRPLNQIQSTFLKLAIFFEKPESAYFDLAVLYKNLDDDWLEWALELITQFFREDTFLIKKPSFALIKDGSEFLNLSQFANYLTEQGVKYDRQKVNLYLERGKIPEPDLLVGGTKYWSSSTVIKYCEKEKQRRLN
jgi:hypothetical protein